MMQSPCSIRLLPGQHRQTIHRCLLATRPLYAPQHLVRLQGAASSVSGPPSSRLGQRSQLAAAPPNSASATLVDLEDIKASDTEPQPASSKPQQFDWFAAWYPIMYECDLDKSIPHRFELLQIPLVIWWEPASSAWRVMEDLCPHRLVPLSEGRINTQGRLECGYHGWEFSGSGRCERIPTGGNEANARACVAAFPCAVKQGLLWVKPQRLPNPISKPEELAQYIADTEHIPIVPELEDPDWVPQDTWRDLPLDYMSVFENTIDVSHVPWTHHKSISNRNQVGDFQLKLAEPVGLQGFKGVWPSGPRAGKLGEQRTFFTAPNYMKHTLDASDTRGFKALTIVYVVPMSPGRSRLINRNVTYFTKTKLPGFFLNRIPKWLIHIGSQVPLEDDQIFLHIGEQEYMQRRAQGQATQQAYFLASPADTFVAAFRSWLDKFAGGGPFGPITQDYVQRIGPRLSRQVLLDRRWAHTDHCATCASGLKTVKAWAKALKAAALACTGAGVLSAAVAVAQATLLAAGGPVGGTAADITAATGNPLLTAVASAALHVGQLVVGAGSPMDQVLRAVVWVTAAAVFKYLRGAVQDTERKFYQGDYPPQRNTAKDP